MQAQDRRIEELHQQASANYLQGKFGEALAAWKQILDQHPDDERALEGVRLCELLAEEGAADVGVEQPPPIPQPAAVPRVAEEEGFDLDLSALDMPDDTAEPEPDPIDAGSSPADAAAAELRQRVVDLVDAARNAHAAGDHDEALALLQRVAILDEDNAQAAVLARTIEQDTGLSIQPSSDGALEIDLGEAAATEAEADEIPDFEVPPMENGLPDLSDLGDTPQPDALSLAATTDDPAEMQDGTATAEGPDAGLDEVAGDEELPDLEDDLDGEEAPLADLEADAEATGGKLPALRLNKMGRLTMAAIVVGVLAIGGGAAWFLTGSGGGSGEETVTPDQALAELGLPTKKKGEKNTENAAGVAGAPTADADAAGDGQPAPDVDVQASLARGNEALAAGNYSEAIVAYNEVLSVAPENLQARDKLEIAAERYRERREVEEQWNRALETFNDGDFRQALVLLYRLPGSEAGARLERYKLNAWYNLGVQALTRGDCRNAREHFAEVQTIDARDPDGVTGVALSRECHTRSDAYYDRISTLELRAIDQ